MNFGIDFRGGMIIWIESIMIVDVGVYCGVIELLGLGDVMIIEVFDLIFEEN